LSKCKTKVLLVESRQADSIKIKNTLSKSTTVKFSLKCIADLTIKDIKNSQFDVLLISQKENAAESVTLLKKY